MVAIDHTSFPAVKFACSLMRPQDRLFLVRSTTTDEGMGPASTQQRILNVFKDLALGEGVRATGVPMLGKTIDTLPKAVQMHKIDVLVMQVPKLRTYTDSVKKITVAAASSILLFKHDARERELVRIAGATDSSFRVAPPPTT